MIVHTCQTHSKPHVLVLYVAELEVMCCSLHCFLAVCVSVCPLAYLFPAFDPVDSTRGRYSTVEI